MNNLSPEPRPQSLNDIFGHSWQDRQVLIVGLGRSGLAAAEWLCRLGAHVVATDVRDTPALRATREVLLRQGVRHVELGGHSESLVTDSDVVIASPGVSEHAGPVRWALEHGMPILSEVELAFRFCPSPIVAVTGTNGKSTAVSLIAEMLKAAGRQAIACGNLGIPFTSVLPQLSSETIAVVEVSSFQLLGCHLFRPKIGVLLNLGTNHLDRHADTQAYLAAKARLFQQQTPDDWALLNAKDPLVSSLGHAIRARCVWFGANRTNGPAFELAPETLRALTESSQAVLQVGRLLGVPDPLVWQVIRTFRGLEHRLEYVATWRGVHFINDSKSTTPDSCLFALHQVNGAVVPILGGRDKGLDFAPLVERLHDQRIKGVVLLGESRQRLRTMIDGSTVVRVSETLEEAVRSAVGLAGPGTTVLFSPACASFDMFRDFEDRGRAFKHVVNRLTSSALATCHLPLHS